MNAPHGSGTGILDATNVNAVVTSLEEAISLAKMNSRTKVDGGGFAIFASRTAERTFTHLPIMDWSKDYANLGPEGFELVAAYKWNGTDFEPVNTAGGDLRYEPIRDQ